MDINILILFSFIYSNMNWNKTQESRVVLVDTESSAEWMNEWVRMVPNGTSRSRIVIKLMSPIADQWEMNNPKRGVTGYVTNTITYMFTVGKGSTNVLVYRRRCWCVNTLPNQIDQMTIMTEKKTRLSKQYVRACVHVYVSVQ